MSPTHAEYSPFALNIDVASLMGVTQDSRAVQKGFLFAALKGVASDGYDYIPSAIENGASVILTDRAYDNAQGVQIVTTDNPRKALAHIAAEYYGGQPAHIIAVTGTNGKSSVVHFIDYLWKSLELNATYIGTLSGNMTTPDPITLQHLLAQMGEDGIDHVAMEASSHGLDQYRMDGVNIDVAAFTSFSQDHLDYHPDMESYMAAKLRLFSEVLPINGTAVLNANSAAFDELSSVCKRRGIRVISYGEAGEDIRLISRDIHHAGQNVKVEIFGKEYGVALPLVGRFQVMNILCALACILAQYPEKTEVLINALSSIEPVPGRLQHVTDGTRNAYIDYAHTPDALENVINALRPHTKSRLICVFGCGGDRDKTKRPLMGDAVSRLADIAIVTDDNPRSENPETIRHEIIGGMTGDGAEIMNISGRREAILLGVDMMGQGDILLVAGKGHEQGQIFNGVTEPFDDVRETLGAMLGDKVKTSA
ncbi:MAG: UDP-N-acetylmuramoyl-L-alanyl-D-glutamate--2,6-diaminopimelate ligase [Alphaproteobacteria bacterium]